MLSSIWTSRSPFGSSKLVATSGEIGFFVSCCSPPEFRCKISHWSCSTSSIKSCCSITSMGGSELSWCLPTLGCQEFLSLPLDWIWSLLPMWKAPLEEPGQSSLLWCGDRSHSLGTGTSSISGIEPIMGNVGKQLILPWLRRIPSARFRTLHSLLHNWIFFQRYAGCQPQWKMLFQRNHFLLEQNSEKIHANS